MRRVCRLAVALLIGLLVSGTVPPKTSAEGGLSLRWPFAPGRDWVIQQGYNGSTHTAGSEYVYSLDLIVADGPAATVGQPVYAAAEGDLLSYWDASTGSLFMRHEATTADGAHYYTFYIHIDPVVDVSDPAQRHVTAGQLLGHVAPAGTRANGGNPHVHFTLVASFDPLCDRGHRIPIPFGDFIAGYSFPATGAAEQYTGRVVRQGEGPTPAAAVSQATVAPPTETPVPPSATPRPPTATWTPLPTATPTATATSTATCTATSTPTLTATATPTATVTPSPTPTVTPTPVPLVQRTLRYPRAPLLVVLLGALVGAVLALGTRRK